MGMSCFRAAVGRLGHSIGRSQSLSTGCLVSRFRMHPHGRRFFSFGKKCKGGRHCSRPVSQAESAFFNFVRSLDSHTLPVVIRLKDGRAPAAILCGSSITSAPICFFFSKNQLSPPHKKVGVNLTIRRCALWSELAKIRRSR